MFHRRVTLELKIYDSKVSFFALEYDFEKKIIVSFAFGFGNWIYQKMQSPFLSCYSMSGRGEKHTVPCFACYSSLSDLYPSHVIPCKRCHKRDITFFQLHLKLANRVISEQETSVPPCARVKIDRTAVHSEANVWLSVVGLEC